MQRCLSLSVVTHRHSETLSYSEIPSYRIETQAREDRKYRVGSLCSGPLGPRNTGITAGSRSVHRSVRHRTTVCNHRQKACSCRVFSPNLPKALTLRAITKTRGTAASFHVVMSQKSGQDVCGSESKLGIHQQLVILESSPICRDDVVHL
jgi:hypothetical protein